MLQPPTRRSADISLPAWSNLRLSTQLLLVLLACNVPVFIAFHLYDIRATRAEIHALETDTLDILKPLVANAIEQSMLSETGKHVAELLVALRKSETIEFAQLLDSDHRVVNVSDLSSKGVVRRRDFSLPVDAIPHTSEFPLLSTPACVRCHGAHKKILGYVRLTTTATRAHHLIRRLYAARAAMVGAGFLCLILSVYLVVRRMVRDPMRRILDAMAEVRRGRLNTRISPGKSQEFSRIFEYFNSMVGDIEKDRKEILDLHRRQLSHLDRLTTVGELAAHLAHELRNPLTGIGSTIQVLMSEAGEASPKRHILEKILAQLDRMDKTMSSFLRYTRMPEAVIREFKVHEPLQRILPLLMPRLKAQNIEIHLDVSEALPCVCGDAGQIEQIFLNLCLNGAQAMPDGGRLTIAAREWNGMLRVEVSDTGSGIRPEDLEKIFQPFYTTREKGSGLGLSLTKQIVMAHGGELTLESVPGSGTSVFFTLPLAAPGGAA